MKIKIVILAVLLFCLVGLIFYKSANNNFANSPILKNLRSETNKNSDSNVNSDKRAEEINFLTNSPIAKTTRSIFDYILSKDKEEQEKIISNQPFSGDVSIFLTPERLKSKFVIVAGSEIPAVGAQIFILFPDYPDAIFRAAFQKTNSTTTPFSLVEFTRSEDKKTDIKQLVTELKTFFNDPSVGI